MRFPRSLPSPRLSSTLHSTADAARTALDAVDAEFAAQCGIKFYRLDHYFLGQRLDPPPEPPPEPPPPPGPSILPTILETSAPCEALLLVGPPGAGKSTFAKRWLVPHGYIYINQDLLGSRDRCVDAAHAALTRGQRCVVDNTNPDKLTRSHYVALGRSTGAPVRCLWLSTELDIARRLNRARHDLSGGALRFIPEDAYARYVDRFEAPDVGEGFTEIHRVDFELLPENDRHLSVLRQMGLCPT